MANCSKGKTHYNISSGTIEVDLEASNRVGDYATLTVEDRDPNTYESLEEPYMNVNLGESPNEEKYERKVRTTITRFPRKWMYIGVLTAVILLLVIAVGFIVFLLVSSRSEGNSEESGRCPQYTDIENGRVVNTTGSKHGDVIEIECDEGYGLKGTNIITCTASGVWDGLPTCKVSCGVPYIPTHAFLSDITGTSFQATASFKCDDGFYLDGNSMIRCQANGLWTTDSTCKVQTDCYDLFHFAGEKADGVYTIVMWKTHQSIQVYCDMTTDGGGWTVFQYRFNGSVDFYRNFTEYEHGFGNLNTEFWLGLNYIQEISSQEQTNLRIDLESANGTRAFEKFENFYLSPYPDFTLHLGNTTDSLHISGSRRFGPYHNGLSFSTFDNDVDAFSYTNCAIDFSGALWYRNCYNGNLNGLYITPGINDNKAINYLSFLGNQSLKKTKMMMKRT